MCCGYPSRVLTVFIFRPLSPARRDSGFPERHQYVASHQPGIPRIIPPSTYGLQLYGLRSRVGVGFAQGLHVHFLSDFVRVAGPTSPGLGPLDFCRDPVGILFGIRDSLSVWSEPAGLKPDYHSQAN